MRNLLIPVILLALSQACLSHPGADHVHVEPGPVTSTQAAQKAKRLVDKKVSEGKLPSSWLKVNPGEAYKKKTERGEEWVVEFKDPKADKSRSKIYVLMGLTGQISVFKLTGK